MAAYNGSLEKVRRCVRMVFVVVVMVTSLLVMSLPVLVSLGDIVAPSLLISSFTCVRCYGFKEHLNRYAFKSSLIDIPLVSIARSLIITCTFPVILFHLMPSFFFSFFFFLLLCFSISELVIFLVLVFGCFLRMQAKLVPFNLFLIWFPFSPFFSQLFFNNFLLPLSTVLLRVFSPK